MGFQDTRFNEAVTLLNLLDPDLSSKDKRRANRMTIRITVRVKGDPSDLASDWRRCELRDLSPRGMRLKMEKPIDCGRSFLVQFPCEEGKQKPAPLICNVVHCIGQRDGTFIVGAEFTGRAPEFSPVDDNDEADRIRKSILG